MKIAIIQFPGSNCERESALAIKRAGMEPVEFLWNKPVEELETFDGYFLVGGFSYEDRSRAGIIASLDPIMRVIRREGEKGKPVLGICNGAQILVETGMIPQLNDYRPGMALAVNRREKNGHVVGTGYYNAWVNVQLTAPNDRCAFSRDMKPGKWLTIPIAHTEGRFMMPDTLLHELQTNDQTVFRYCDHNGKISPEFPVNPNGSMGNLAAVCNPAGNVMAMMPHPERTTDGDPVFTSMRSYIKKGKHISAKSLLYDHPNSLLHDYKPSNHSFELIVDLIITDNEAVSVEDALNDLNLPATVKRRTHWEIILESNSRNNLKSEVIGSGELFNSNKEVLVDEFPGNYNSASFLVRYKDDVEGQHKREVLEEWFHLKGIKYIKKGTLWTISSKDKDENIENILDKVLATHILFNPFSHDCFKYKESDARL